jgi:uncharacterized protein
MMNVNEIIIQIRQALQNMNVNKVILFGSWATGNQNIDSDIDLFIVTNDDFIPDSFSRKMEIKLRISSALSSLRKHSDIDLIVHTKPMFKQFVSLNSGFKRELFETGRVIYEADN